MSGVEYRILGSLEALRDGRQLPLGGSKQRAVLAFLLMRANRVATTDELIEALWPTSPPGRPQTAIQGYVSQLRKTLDPAHPFEVIVTEPAGYRLHVGPDDLDLFRLESLLRRGRDALDQNRAEVAASAFREALSLYRGPPLADFNYESWAQSDIGRLDELRHTSVEERIEADLRLGRHGELVGEIEGLVAEHPLRERMRAHQMLALYRSGRQSEALAAYQDARQVLVEQFGIDPTRALQELERKILLQDPSLDFEPTARGLSETVGELTLLLTDIEGSTRLVHRLGSDYAHVLLEHRRLLREALEGHNGRIVDNYGDCFFATFSQPLDAAAAVAAAQRALTGYEWPERVPVKVRMGLHTGEPVAVGGGLVGLDVHRTARICDAAHGGQVLLSKETADLLTASPLEGLEIRDLGDHALKDLTQPERLFQLVIPGVDDEFPAPRSEQASRTPAAERSILVVPRQGDSAERLVEVAVPLAHSVVPHELIVTRLVEVAGRTAVDLEEALARATSELHELRASLAGREIGARVAAFTSAAVGEDVVRLASEQAVDLVLLARAKEHLEGGALDSELTTILAAEGDRDDIGVFDAFVPEEADRNVTR